MVIEWVKIESWLSALTNTNTKVLGCQLWVANIYWTNIYRGRFFEALHLHYPSLGDSQFLLMKHAFVDFRGNHLLNDGHNCA